MRSARALPIRRGPGWRRPEASPWSWHSRASDRSPRPTTAATRPSARRRMASTSISASSPSIRPTPDRVRAPAKPGSVLVAAGAQVKPLAVGGIVQADDAFGAGEIDRDDHVPHRLLSPEPRLSLRAVCQSRATRGGLPGGYRAASRTRCSSWDRGTTSSTSPHDCAVTASMDRPVMMRSRVLAAPMRRGIDTVPPGAGDQPEAAFGEPEHGVLRCDDPVGEGRQLDAGAEAGSVKPDDDALAQARRSAGRGCAGAGRRGPTTGPRSCRTARDRHLSRTICLRPARRWARSDGGARPERRTARRASARRGRCGAPAG